MMLWQEKTGARYYVLSLALLLELLPLPPILVLILSLILTLSLVLESKPKLKPEPDVVARESWSLLHVLCSESGVATGTGPPPPLLA